MITTNWMYEKYSEELVNRIEYQVQCIASYVATKTYLLEQLKAYKPIIEKYCDVSFEEFQNGTNVNILKEYSKCYFIVTSRIDATYDKAIALQRKIIAVNKLLARAESRRKYYKNQLITEKAFKALIRNFNKEILISILYKGYEFNLGYGVSSLSILRKKRFFGNDSAMSTTHNNRVVNWGESNKLKKQIIDRGELPLKGDNGGVPWLVYFTNDSECWYYWRKAQCTLKNHILYSFTPSKSAKLALQIAKKDELALANYTVK